MGTPRTKRANARYLLTEDKRAPKVQRSIDAEPEQLPAIAAEVLAGKALARPWELFRLCHFPWLESEHVKAALRKWARANGIEIKFETRDVGADKQIVSVDYVLFRKFGAAFVY
jgi:hypothetical protein